MFKIDLSGMLLLQRFKMRQTMNAVKHNALNSLLNSKIPAIKISVAYLMYIYN